MDAEDAQITRLKEIFEDEDFQPCEQIENYRLHRTTIMIEGFPFEVGTPEFGALNFVLVQMALHRFSQSGNKELIISLQRLSQAILEDTQLENPGMKLYYLLNALRYFDDNIHFSGGEGSIIKGNFIRGNLMILIKSLGFNPEDPDELSSLPEGFQGLF